MILLDPRQGSLVLKSHIPSRHRVVPCLLDNGDASFIGHGPDGLIEAAIEVKHISDLLQSLEDGRLPTKQILGMRCDYDYVFLLIHDRIRSDLYGHLQVWIPTGNKKDGNGSNNRKGPDVAEQRAQKYNAPGYERGYWADAIFGARQRLMWIDFQKWVISLSVKGGVRLLYAGSNQEAGEAIAAAYEWFRKKWGDHHTFNVFDESHTPTLIIPSVPMIVAHGLVYGVGWEKAAMAADHFKTVRSMVNADKSEWLKIDGFGKVLSDRAQKAMDTVHVHRTVSGRAQDKRKRSQSP